jgi:hypothetical protein
LTDRLTCQDLVELVTDYLEGALGSAERERVERHPDSCAPAARTTSSNSASRST